MKITTAQRKRAKIRLSIQGPSGSGKTYSSLLLAKGLTAQWSDICVIDTENHSADLYSHLGDYNVLTIGKPFTPESYMQAIDLCEQSGIKVIVIDSLSHEWDGDGGILEIHSSMMGNSFTNWSKVTPRHNALVQRMLQSSSHVIATFRTKQEYVLSDKNGKVVPEKVGMKSVTKDGMDYEFTTVFDLDIKHNATCSKDRTGLFSCGLSFKVNEETGNQIATWCEGLTVVNVEEQLKPSIAEMVDAVKDMGELVLLWETVEHNQSNYDLFTQRKRQIQAEGRKSDGTY
jgi:hypothetical protein